MKKINITTNTGMAETLTLLSAFKANDNTYVIFDSEKTGSMGLPIIYVSKLTTKLEKIVAPEEWQNAKNYLKGIISGTNFEYIAIDENESADEAYYTPLTLPQASFDLIKSRYEVSSADVSAAVPTLEPVMTSNPEPIAVTPIVEPTSVAPTSPVIPSPTIPSNMEVNNTPIVSDPVAPVVTPVSSVTPVSAPAPEIAPISSDLKTINFDNDKETFLKACENMFDALVSKYQKELADLEQREKELAIKEQEINLKMQNAQEHLANAEAKEQVANIAHDNAQRIMDLNSIMPEPPISGNPTSVV